MAYTTSTHFGSTNQYHYIAPAYTLLYCFSPYYVEIETETAGQEVVILSGTYTTKRYSNASKKAKFDLSELLQSYFKDIEFGQVLASGTESYVNASTKLMQLAKDIVFKVGDDTSGDWLTLTYDIIWGAIQRGDVLETESEIYLFGDLPLTVTQSIGEGFQGNGSSTPTEADSYGKEIDIQKVFSSGFTSIELKTSTTVFKTITIKELSYCNDGVYLRWINKGEYKYFFFNIGGLADSLKDGSTFWHNIWSLEAENNEFKSDLRLKNKTGNETIDCGVKTATYAQQLHLIGLQRSIQRWMLVGSDWIEVQVEMTPVIIDRFHSNQEINLTVIKPSLYIESL